MGIPKALAPKQRPTSGPRNSLRRELMFRLREQAPDYEHTAAPVLGEVLGLPPFASFPR